MNMNKMKLYHFIYDSGAWLGSECLLYKEKPTEVGLYWYL